MAQIISFDDKCREKDTLRHVEMIRRRACARMDASEAKHQETLQTMQENHTRRMKRLDMVGLCILIAGLAGGVYFLCSG